MHLLCLKTQELIHRYSVYGIGFDWRSSFSFPGGGFGQNVLLFGVDMSSSAHINNTKIDILVLGKGSTQGWEHALTTEKMYSINFTVIKRKFWNCSNSIMLRKHFKR